MKERTPSVSALIQDCKRGNPEGQRQLYQLFYSYGMSICLRYAANHTEAKEILNDGFYKAFNKLDQFDADKADFKAWFRSILIHQSIDYHRKYHKTDHLLTDTEPSDQDASLVANAGWDNLLFDDVMECVHQLPPQYRLVFNLFAIEGKSHRDIAAQLGITEGTSKSNFAKARQKLMLLLKHKGY